MTEPKDNKASIQAVIERNQSEMLRRIEKLEHAVGIETYSHAKAAGRKLIRRLGDYCPTVVEYEDDELCYLCGKIGVNLSYEEHTKQFGKLMTCKSHEQRQETNNGSAGSDEGSANPDNQNIKGSEP